jgi:hypothetical protein
MKNDQHKGGGQTGTAAKKSRVDVPGNDPRQDRLKLALRENLKRRKSQARERSDAPAAPVDEAAVSPHSKIGKDPSQ